MKYRYLGSSGLKVSIIGLGTSKFGGQCDLKTTRNIIAAAVDSGINLLDTADIYQEGRSEEYLGKAIKAYSRDKILIASKVRHRTDNGPNDHGISRHHILNGIESSLKRLNTDYIDLYQIHCWDDGPIDEAMCALNDLVRWGRVRYIGASNFSAWQITHANAVAEMNGWTKFISIQPHYHMLERSVENEIVPVCEYFNLGILPYYPLAGGFLTGKYKRGKGAPKGSRGETCQYVQSCWTKENYDKLEKLEAFSIAREYTVSELAHAWLMTNKQVSSVISGATKEEHIIANAKSTDLNLTNEEIKLINDIL